MKTLLDSCARPAASLRRAWWALPPRLITAILHARHMPFAPLLAWAAILTELVGGCAVLAGAFVLGGSGPFALESLLVRKSPGFRPLLNDAQ